jgi:hypothetical protein
MTSEDVALITAALNLAMKTTPHDDFSIGNWWARIKSYDLVGKVISGVLSASSYYYPLVW